MSTKIYNAYRFRGNLQTLLGELQKLQSTFQDLVVEEFLRQIPSGTKIPFGILRRELTKMAGSGLRFSPLDLDPTQVVMENPQCEVVLYPHRPLLVQFFGVPSWLPIRMEGLEDFHYQNCSDRPREVSRAAWAHRKKVWDRILQDRTPAQSGFTFPLVDLKDSGLALKITARLGK